MRELKKKSIIFDKSEMKDLVIYQMVKFMQQNWSDEEVFDLFLESQYKFIESDKSRAEVVKELMIIHKSALKEEQNFVRASNV